MNKIKLRNLNLFSERPERYEENNSTCAVVEPAGLPTLDQV